LKERMRQESGSTCGISKHMQWPAANGGESLKKLKWLEGSSERDEGKREWLRKGASSIPFI
jgi:hypothetical protein